MKGFFLSLQSEFYKSRNTLGFWSAILLPFILILFVSIGFYTHSDKLAHSPGMILWLQFAGLTLNIMGALLLPMFVIFIGYSVNSVEHKADTWKTLFSLPIPKWSVYSAKFVYALLLVFITLLLFAVFTIGFGDLLGLIKPTLKFGEYHAEWTLFQIYFKLFLAALGILSVQFLLSLLWSDFLKPMGIGFVLFIVGVITVGSDWTYAYLIPYAHPMLALKSMIPHRKGLPLDRIVIDIFTHDVFVSLIVFAVVFVAGFFIVQRKSVK